MRKALAQQQAGQSPAAVQRRLRKKPASAGLKSSKSRYGFPAAQFSDVSLTLNNGSPALAQRKLVESLQQSHRVVAQREKAQSLQLKAGGKLVQEKAEVTQRVEEELMQGKFEAAQRVEEEELLQGKFETAQLVEEEEPLQGKFETAQLVDEDEDLVQGKFETVQLEEEAAAGPNKTGLPDKLKAGIESLSGKSMDAVRVHYNSDKPAQLNAHAYAQGKDIHVASGQEKHLPHEAWHIVQQAQGRVSPTAQMSGGVQVNDDKGLETEADIMGAKAMQFKPAKRQQKNVF